MVKFLKYVFITVIALFILWIDVPFTIPINFAMLGRQINTEIRPLSIHTIVGGWQINKDFETKLGLDLEGGSHLVFEADTSNIAAEDLEDALNSARDVIERRVNLFGVAEPQVRTIKSGNKYRISVDLPGVQDVSEAAGLIGQTAQLSFREMPAEITPELATAPAILQITQKTSLTGKDIKKASVVFDPQTGEPTVSLDFTDEGTKEFSDITRRNVGKPVGIFLDEFPISAPVVQTAITDGNAVISGNFTTEGASQLAVAINSGALPLPIDLVEQRNIGPTLGQQEVNKSVMAGVVGLSMVMLFMVLFYGKFGVIACLGLIIYGLINFAIFRAIPIVLTLPGIAGFLLSIGMAVDSNILIFERIKDEQRKGKSLKSAISVGFGRAIDAIKDANITTLLVAFILFNPLNWEFLPQFGLVRGFALTLAIGVATSLFTGVVITRRLIRLFYKN